MQSITLDSISIIARSQRQANGAAYRRFTMAVSFTLTDFGQKPESTTFRVPTIDVTAANFDAQWALVQSLRTQVSLLTLGNIKKYTFTAREVEPTPTTPTSLAQRENKWLIRYRDEVANKNYRAELGTADLSLLTVDDFLDILTPASPGADFVAAFQDLVRSDDGNAVVVQSIQFVGRNT